MNSRQPRIQVSPNAGKRSPIGEAASTFLMTTSRVNPNSLDLADVAMPRLDEDGDKPLSADLAAEHDMLSDTLIKSMDSAIAGTQRIVRKPIPVL